MFQRRRHNMKMSQESEWLEELHVQTEQLTTDLQPTSRAVSFMEQDTELHAKLRQEQHHVVQQEIECLEELHVQTEQLTTDLENAMEDIEEHNEKFAAIRGIVEWLKEGQDGLTQAVQQVSSWW